VEAHREPLPARDERRVLWGRSLEIRFIFSPKVRG
jgi:hypothetical protein